MNYSILDSNGLCINQVVWDGISDWLPPANTTLVAGRLDLGSRYEQDGEGAWVVVEAPPEPAPIPRWVQFGAALAADAGVNAMVATAATAAPVLHLMLGVGLGQAAQGDPQTFAAAWNSARSAGLVSAELAASIAAMAGSFDLPAEFVEGLTAEPGA